MFHVIETVLEVNRFQSWLAQVAIPTAESTQVFISGSQFFIALFAGVVMAFAFQFLLTNLSVAAGISAKINPLDTEAEGWSHKIQAIEAKLGSGTIFIVNVAIFVACFLAVKLTLIHDLGLGAIIAVVIWSVYFLLLLWLSSQAVGSLVGAVGSTASSGLQGAIAVITTALSGRAANSQIVNTVESSVEAVTKELQSALSSERLRESLEDYVAKLQLPKSTLKHIPNQALNLLGNSNLPSGSSTDLFNMLKSANPEDLASGKMRERLTQMLGLGNSHGDEQSQDKGGVGLRERTLQFGTEALIALLAGRQNLTPENTAQIFNELKSNRDEATRSAKGDRLQDFPTELADYLRNTQREELNPEGIKRDLQLLVKQPQAGMGQLSDRLSHINRDTLVALLSQREDIAPEEASEIADRVISVRDSLLEQVQNTQTQIKSAVDSSLNNLRKYLNGLEQPELNYEGIGRDLRKLFNDPEAGVEALRDRLNQFDRETLVAILSSRADISEEQANRIIDQIESARDSVLHRAQRAQEQADQRIKVLKHKAKEQMAEVQKTAAAASWWLFGTAITSVATAAIAGVLASGGFNFLG